MLKGLFFDLNGTLINICTDEGCDDLYRVCSNYLSYYGVFVDQFRLKGLYFDSLLDVGSGRGAFLLPFMDTFPYVSVTSLDILDKRYQMLKDMEIGGLEMFEARKESICETALIEKSFDVVTMLEVLEHIPDYEKAIENRLLTVEGNALRATEFKKLIVKTPRKSKS